MFSVFVNFLPVAVPSIQTRIERHIKPAAAKKDLCGLVLRSDDSFWVHSVLAIHLDGPSVRK